MGVTVKAPRITTNPAKPWSTLEKPVKGQCEKDGHGRGEQISQHAKAEKHFVRSIEKFPGLRAFSVFTEREDVWANDGQNARN